MLKFTIKIKTFEVLESIPVAWSEADYRELLELFNFPDAQSVKSTELREMCLMSITDFEPAEAAAILLKYRLGESLNAGQIQQLSHDMQHDKISEEYPDIPLHYQLYNVNQLLRAAYNGTFPNTKAVMVEFDLLPGEGAQDVTIDKEIVLKALAGGLPDNALIKRLYSEHLAGNESFDDAEGILWEMQVATTAENHSIQVFSSEYWLDDLSGATEFETEVFEFQGELAEEE